MSKLTAKQEKFCQLVAEGNTYADAYREAYNSSKMSNSTIYVHSSRLMDDAKITLRVEELKKEAVKRSQITLDQVLQEMSNWMTFDPLSIIDEKTEAVKSLKDMDKKSRMSLAEIHVQEIWGTNENPDGKKIREKIGELKKIKFIDKRAVSDQFMKKFGAYINDKGSETASNLEAIKEIIEKIKG